MEAQPGPDESGLLEETAEVTTARERKPSTDQSRRLSSILQRLGCGSLTEIFASFLSLDIIN